MDLLAKVYFLAFAVGALFALVSWLLAHVHLPGHHGSGGHHGHGHGHAHGSIVGRVLLPIANISALAAMACVGGAVGYISLALGVGAASSIVLSVSTGLIAAYGVGSLLGWLDKSTRYLEHHDVRGTVATVLHRIAPTGVGEVTYALEGRRIVLPAKSEGDGPIDEGDEVIVVGFENGIAKVSRSSDMLRSEGGGGK